MHSLSLVSTPPLAERKPPAKSFIELFQSLRATTKLPTHELPTSNQFPRKSFTMEAGIFRPPRPKKSVLPALQRGSKKRKTEHKIEEISFDDSSRADYLTGFHKRKVARAKLAQAQAVKMARDEKIQMRKQVGIHTKARLEQVSDFTILVAGRTKTRIGRACGGCE